MSSHNFILTLRRHRALARTLHARLWVSADGRVVLATGRVDFARLRSCLLRRSAPPTAVEAPTPKDLGILSGDGELTEFSLHAIARALGGWSRALDCESTLRPAHRRVRDHIDKERREIARLERRLAACRSWRSQLAAGKEPAGAPLLLDETEEKELLRGLAEVSANRPLPPLLAWLARVVLWISGRHAMSRFLKTTAALAHSWDQFAPADQLLKLERRILVWRKRSRCEPPYAILAEMRHTLAAFPPHLVAAGKLSCRPKNHPLAPHCDQLLERCRELRTMHHRAGGHRIPATLAAWSAADGGTAPLPTNVIAIGMNSKSSRTFERLITALANQFGQPGYDALLPAIEGLSEVPFLHEIDSLRQLLVRGASLEDLAWAAHHGQIWRLANGDVRVDVVRRMFERFERVGAPLAVDDLRELTAAVKTPRGAAIVERWIGWIGQFSARCMTPRIKQVLVSATKGLLFPALAHRELGECLKRWLNAAPGETIDYQDDPQSLGGWLRRIAAFQRLAGEPTSIPKSVQKVLPTKREAAPVASSYLRADRAAQEALVMTATNALRLLLQKRVEALWLDAVGVPLLEMPLPRALKLAVWIGNMDDEQRRLLRTVGSGWALHGGDYKRHLEQNQGWIGKFQSSGGDLEAWTAATAQPAALGGEQVSIGVVRDPREIILMGEYFATCLSMGDINEMSVLANAHDANKQVVFVVGRTPTGNRRVVARQLITVSSDLRLLGYRCYMAIDKRQQSDRQDCIALVAAYCGRLARQCGLRLADVGTPDAVGSHYWWDDGTHTWHPAAQQAWNAEDERLRGIHDANVARLSVARGEAGALECREEMEPSTTAP